MHKKIRIALAALLFVGITLLLLDISGTLHVWLGWMAKIQFLPAVLALNLAVIVGLLLLTLLFGRVYCSVICPLGIWQDIVSNLSGRRKGKKSRFTASPERKWLRYGVWVLFVAALLAGVQVFVALLAPYSAWGRIVQNLFQPLYIWGNNLLAWIAGRAGSYAFYPREVWLRSLPTFLIALATLVTVTVLAWKNGRTWCNTLCPVGTTLGFFSRFALFRPVLDLDVCVRCHHCEKNCKASCIDIDAGTIDHSRCVACFDCVDSCPLGGLKYRFTWKRKASHAGPAPAQADHAASLPGGGPDGGCRRPVGPCPEHRGRCRRGRQETRWRICGYRSEKRTRADGSHHPARQPERKGFLSALHRLPAVCGAMPQQRLAPVHRPGAPDAAADEF